MDTNATMPRRRHNLFKPTKMIDCHFRLQQCWDKKTRPVNTSEKYLHTVLYTSVAKHRMSIKDCNSATGLIILVRDPANLWLIRDLLAVMMARAKSLELELLMRQARDSNLVLCARWGMFHNSDLLLAEAARCGNACGIRAAVRLGATRLNHALIRTATACETRGIKLLRRCVGRRLSAQDYADARWHVETYGCGTNTLGLLERYEVNRAEHPKLNARTSPINHHESPDKRH